MHIHPLIFLAICLAITSTVQNEIGLGPTARGSFSSSDLKIARSQSQPSKRADASPNSNNRAGDALVSWWFWGQTPDQLSNFLASDNARPIQLRVENPNIPTFAGSMVLNEGSYYNDWSYYYGYDATDLNAMIVGQTMICLDPYNNGNGLVFVAVTVPAVVAWWWYLGLDVMAVNTNLNTNNARLLSAQPYLNGGGVVYAVIMISNAASPVQWQWMTGVSFSSLSNTLASNNREQPLALAANPNGGWDSITTPSSGVNWWMWVDLTPDEVTASIQSHTSLIIELQSYLNNGNRLYAGIEYDNSTSSPTSSLLPQSTSLSSSTSSSSSPTSSHPASPTSPSASSLNAPSKRKAKIVAGTVVGIVALGASLLVATYLYRQKRHQEGTESMLNALEDGSSNPPSPSSPGGNLNGGQQMVEAVRQPISYPTSSMSVSGSVSQHPLPEL